MKMTKADLEVKHGSAVIYRANGKDWFARMTLIDGELCRTEGAGVEPLDGEVVLVCSGRDCMTVTGVASATRIQAAKNALAVDLERIANVLNPSTWVQNPWTDDSKPSRPSGPRMKG